MTRKQHTMVSQDIMLEFLQEQPPGWWPLPDLALVFDVSEATVRRKCDGLVYQGKLLKQDGHPGGPIAAYQAKRG